MISLENVSKRFAQTGAPAVDSVSIEIPERTTVALIGPSGCGKTTTLRMINRLIEPTSGRIRIAGEDVTTADPVMLRRRIGYVIQQVGLFPHHTIAENIATVPRLLGWSPAKIAARVKEMLELIALDPDEFGSRFPRQLSGGQRQRVGVARALAADPPVLLMDEPFGAIDPIARTRLQDEVRDILRRVGKTVVMVTHDLDEAVKMGDRIAIMNEGRVVQYDTPDRLMAAPANSFVEDFVGSERALMRLSLIRVRDVMEPNSASHMPDLIKLSADLSVREAMSQLLLKGAERASVEDGSGSVVGQITVSSIFRRK